MVVRVHWNGCSSGMLASATSASVGVHCDSCCSLYAEEERINIQMDLFTTHVLVLMSVISDYYMANNIIYIRGSVI